MNKLIYIGSLFILLSSISCKKYVDIEQRGVATAATVTDLRKILNNRLSNGTGNELWYSDEIGQIPQSTFNAILFEADRRGYRFEDFMYNEIEADIDWVELYKTIGSANYILQNVDVLPDPTFERRQVKGEALVHRANSYFLLANLYAKNYTDVAAATELGVPLLTEFGNPGASLKRASIKEVYDLIIADLTAAKDLLTSSTNFNIKPNKVTALALLAKVYLQMGKYDLARDNSAAALALNSTVVNYNSLPVANIVLDFNVASPVRLSVRPAERLNPEMIFFSLSQYSVDLGPVLNGSIVSQSPTVTQLVITTSDSYLTPQLLTLGNQYDIRFANMILAPGGVKRFFGFGNYLPEGNGYSRGIDVPEVILIHAESVARTGDYNVAMTELNNFRAKRFFTSAPANSHVLNAANQLQAIQHILDERQREFMYRGKRMFDIKRLNAIHNAGISAVHILPNGTTVTLAPNANKWAIAIPPKEIALAPELVQNPR